MHVAELCSAAFAKGRVLARIESRSESAKRQVRIVPAPVRSGASSSASLATSAPPTPVSAVMLCFFDDSA
jgi:hypothetical protein